MLLCCLGQVLVLLSAVGWVCLLLCVAAMWLVAGDLVCNVVLSAVHVLCWTCWCKDENHDSELTVIEKSLREPWQLECWDLQQAVTVMLHDAATEAGAAALR